MASLPEGIQLSKINPKYLHTNSTSHVWAFGAFAELIDNAYDPDVGASSLIIDMQEVGNMPCLIFLDNGAGMDKEKLIKMLSFGFCDKGIYNRRESHKPVGLYGNGFKSGSMRLGKDALVFSRCEKSACVGFLSQTYLEAIGADSIIVPILEYSLPDLKRNNNRQCHNNLEAILQYSEFKSEASLKAELNALKSSVTGTKIIIFNLHRLQSGKGELDFQSDRKDIRCPDPYMEDTTNFDNRPINDTPEYKISLRVYCSILYLRPRMKIIIRGHPVKSKYISKRLCQTEDSKYKPSWMKRNDKPIDIKIGFSCEKERKENYGLMLYHKNRLMRAYERVGYQRQANERGVGVIGVVELDFITPTHNKQDFNRDNHFNSIMAGLAGKLNAYWNSQKETQNIDVGKLPDWTWAQCDNCLMWRRLLPGTDGDSLPKQWFCRMNKDAQYNRCFEDEESDAPVDTPRRKRTNKKRNTEPLSEVR
ncbi:unnamed protein product [Lymnaea stagnalis]|uniref:CW-type domain-containing protein n=1 Tax=Lymnaea stagnalis TaxID=6523 RepID=A0AAV2IGD9_LYMST